MSFNRPRWNLGKKEVISGMRLGNFGRTVSFIVTGIAFGWGDSPGLTTAFGAKGGSWGWKEPFNQVEQMYRCPYLTERESH